MRSGGGGAVQLRVRALLRRSIGATVFLSILVGVAGALVLTGVIGARRAQTTYDDLLARNEPPDAVAVFCEASCDIEDGVDPTRYATPEDLAFLASLPGVTATSESTCLLGQLVPEGRAATARDSGVGCLSLRPVPEALELHPVVVEGRPFDPGADELVLDEEQAARGGLAVGDHVQITAFTYDQFATLSGGDRTTSPAGSSAAAEIVGVIRQPEDLIPAALDQDAELLGHGMVFLSPALWPKLGPDVARFGVITELELANGDGGVDEVAAALEERYGDRAMVAAGSGWDDSIPAATDGAIRRVISLESAALFAFAALAAVVGLLVVGQALARQTAAESVDDPALRAMGMTTSQTTSVAILRMVPVALAGAAVAVALAVAASPLVPIGVARRAAFDLGFRVDGPALLGGALAVVLVVLGLTLLGARSRPRHRRGRARPVRVLGQLAALGAPPTVLTGARFALQPVASRGSVPTRTAITAALAAVASSVAAIVLVASLSGLVDEPRRVGVMWDAVVGNSFRSEDTERLADELQDVPDVAAVAGMAEVPARIGDHELTLASLVPVRGTLEPVLLDGRLPLSDEEVALGSQTIRKHGAGIGDDITVVLDDTGTLRTLRVVGRVVLPTSGSLEVTPGSGGYVHPDLLELAGGGFQSSLALRFDEDADPTAVIAALKQRYPSNVITPLAPFDVADVVRLRPVAIWLAAAIVVLGVAALLHALILTVTRRRHDLAVLAALGLPSRQLGASIGWQAVTFGVIGVVLGIPLGILVGRIGFRALADTLGVADVAELPLGAVGAIVAAVALVTIVAAVGPAIAATRVRLADALRSE